MVVIPPDHMALVAKTLTAIRPGVYFENARRQTDLLAEVGRIANPRLPSLKSSRRAAFAVENREQLTFIECGGIGGRFSAVIPRWVGSTNAVRKQIV